MKDKYENMTSEELTKAFEKLGIVKMIDRTESVEDPNIRFSRFDTCYISEIQYVDMGKSTARDAGNLLPKHGRRVPRPNQLP